MNSLNIGSKQIRPTAASEVAALASEVASMASSLADDMHGKLGPVMEPSSPVCGTTEASKEQELPPFFQELRNRLLVTRTSLYSARDALSRTSI
jgi:hypothetical protein